MKKITFKEFIVQMLSGEKSISSKRVCGLLGWLICLFLAVYTTTLGVAASAIVDTLFVCSTVLLGEDSVTSIWKKHGYYDPRRDHENIENIEETEDTEE